MSDEHRPIEVVDVGRGSTTSGTTGRPRRSATDVLLLLLVVGVFIGAACSAFTAWTVREQAADEREINCAYMTVGGGGESREYDDLSDIEQRITDALDCDVEGR